MKTNLEQFNQWLKINTESKNTYLTYLAQMKHFFDAQEKFDQESINNYFASLIDNNKSKSSINQANKAFRKYSQFSKIIVELPKIKREDKKGNSRVYITLDELEKEILPMFSLIFRNWQKRELIIRFMFFSGLRLMEVVNLKREDFNFENRTIKVKNTKNKTDRTVKFTKKILPMIQSQFNIEPEIENAFNISESWIKNMFKKINKDIRYKKHLSAHSTRHSYAKHCLSNDLGIERLQKLLGHADLKTTLIYANPSEDEAHIDYDKYIK